MSAPEGFETKLVHAGEKHPLVERAVTLPIFQSSTYEYWGESDYNEVKYIRLNNTPNHTALAEKISALEQTETAIPVASGMAAISTALLALVEHGGHVISQESLYGGTHHFFNKEFPSMGRSVSFFDPRDLSGLEKNLKKETKVLYVESISNPMLWIPNHKEIVAFAKKHKLITLIDNTFPSPFNFNPAVLGYDVVLHSATKYLNGHSDIVAGAIATSKDLARKIMPLLNHLGPALDPHACFLLHRGMKTLGIRMRWHNDSATKLAKALCKHPRVEKVIYPGLEDHPDHLRAREYFRDFGGVVSFVYRGEVADLDERLKNLKYATLAPSLGGPETLVTRPATTSHSGIPRAERDRLGITEKLVRISVGLESPEDLISDFIETL